MAFDKNKPYGEIFGLTENGARYTQGGVYYNAAGDEVARDESEKPAPAKAAGSKPKAPAKPTAKAALPGTEQVDAENRRALAAEELAE